MNLKMINFIWILCVLVIARESEGNVQGLPIISLSPRLSSAKADPTCSNVYGPICGDCSTLWTCLGGSTAYKTQNCEKNYPGQPYCVDGACSSSPDPNDEQCSTTGITCTGTGYFPNPLNCSQYFFCKGPQGASMPYECPSGFVYNSLTKQCKRRVIPSDCSTVNCASNPNRYTAYVADPTYYALCLVTDDGTTTPIMFKCPDGEEFVQSQRKCVFQCKKEGRIADGKDCTKYYECYRNGLSYITFHQKCLTGFIFSSEENGCIEGTCPVDEVSNSGTGDVTE